jgi:opacity protein-like surface antigen
MAVLAVAGLALAPAAQAADAYAGVKAGFMLADTENQDAAFNIVGLFGTQLLDLGPKAGTLSAEGELSFTLIDGDLPNGNDWDVSTLGAYAVYRSAGDMYLKAKAGLLWRDTNYDSSFTELSMGIGGGWRINKNMALEVEYTTIDDNIDMFSVGVNFHF